jgi:hypothetical protein
MPTPWCRIGKTKLGYREIGLDEKMIHVKYDDLGCARLVTEQDI